MYCTRCGQANEDRAKFCKGCGTPINMSITAGRISSGRNIYEAKDSVVVVKTAPTRRGSVSTWLLLCCVVVAVVGGVWFFAKSPTAVVKQLFDGCDDMDVRAIVSTMEPNFERMINAQDALLGKAIGALTGGFNISMYDIYDQVPFLLKFTGTDTGMRMDASDFALLSISGSAFDAIPLLNNVFSQTAVVAVTVNNNATSRGMITVNSGAVDQNASRIRISLDVKNYSGGGWRIPTDAQIRYIRSV